MYSPSTILVLASSSCGSLTNKFSRMLANGNYTSSCVYKAVFNGGLKRQCKSFTSILLLVSSDLSVNE